jgi:hypothetical protein
MIKPIVTAASFALGGAGVVLVGYLSVNPRAFTHPVADVPFKTPASRSIHLETPVASDTDQMLVLPEVKLTASRRRATNTVRTELSPCSSWNDVGAVFVDPAGATGVRQVRHLCTDGNGR